MEVLCNIIQFFKNQFWQFSKFKHRNKLIWFEYSKIPFRWCPPQCATFKTLGVNIQIFPDFFWKIHYEWNGNLILFWKNSQSDCSPPQFLAIRCIVLRNKSNTAGRDTIFVGALQHNQIFWKSNFTVFKFKINFDTSSIWFEYPKIPFAWCIALW